MKKILAVYGAGGIGREILVIAQEQNRWDKIVFIDDLIVLESINDCEIYSFNDFIKHFKDWNIEIVISVGEPNQRNAILSKIKKFNLILVNLFFINFKFPVYSNFGTGNIINYGTLMLTDITIGNNCYINKNVVLGHDVKIGDNVVISPCVSIGGGTIVADEVFIGTGAVLRDQISIGKGSIIGMGSVVIGSIPEFAVVVGNPAKIIRYNNDKKVFKIRV
jgi:sugar O-acyltransferase (sialic acid O-acetyltransferase NeuD family)